MGEIETGVDEIEQGTPFHFIAGNLALDLVNTEEVLRGRRYDLLATSQDVFSWWQAACHYHLQRRDVRAEDDSPEINVASNIDSYNIDIYTQTLLSALKTLRTALRGIFGALVEEMAPVREDVAVLNNVLKTGHAVLDLTEEGELRSVYQTTDIGKGAILLPIALSAFHLIQEGERKRLHHCGNERCILFFYDTTRSATRRWCSWSCMDRARSSERYQRAKMEKQEG
jgi:predicted RNA-binding Zn ribbon-like protein